jgi:hypothetical protein
VPTYNTINAYDADTRIPEFKGLMQYGDGINGDPRYATSGYNLDTTAGVLQPMAACALMTASMSAPIETLAVLHRRWYVEGATSDVLIAASGGHLYWMLPTGTAWTQFSGGPYLSNVWSWTAYEYQKTDYASPVDVLYMTNTSDGMVRVECNDFTQSVTAVSTPYKFGIIARNSDERLWGTGILTDPDMVVYSQPFLPENWTTDAVVDADDSGDIQQPSWDGDRFIALAKLGSQLIAFRKNSVWRVLGLDPGEYTWKQQYGGGTEFPNTIAVYGDYVLMLGRDGVRMYDGLEVKGFQQEYCADIFEHMNLATLSSACGCVWKDKYYVAFPYGVGQATNNYVLIYSIKDKTWLLRTDLTVAAFLPTDDTLYYTSDATPGRIYTFVEDAWTSKVATTPCNWTGPWTDFNYKNLYKGGWDVYLTVESCAAGTLDVSIETENRKRTKQVILTPTINEVQAKQHCIKFGGRGRRFRLSIDSTGTVAWRIVGGIQITTEIDAD